MKKEYCIYINCAECGKRTKKQQYHYYKYPDLCFSCVNHKTHWVKHSNIQLYNWREEKVVPEKTMKDITKSYKFTKNDRIHLYPLLNEERLIRKQFCLQKYMRKYIICNQYGQEEEVNNWIKWLKEKRLRSSDVQKLVLGKILYLHRDKKGLFFLKENEGQIPKKEIKVGSYVSVDGADYFVPVGGAVSFCSKHNINRQNFAKMMCRKNKKRKVSCENGRVILNDHKTVQRYVPE